MRYLAFLCRQEHRFREICWILGLGAQPAVATCGGLLRPSRSPIKRYVRSQVPDLEVNCQIMAALLAGWLAGRLLRGLSVESHTLDALERPADIQV